MNARAQVWAYLLYRSSRKYVTNKASQMTTVCPSGTCGVERQDGCHDDWPPATVSAHVSISGHGLTGPARGGPAARPLYPSLPFVFGLQDLQVLLVRSRPALTSPGGGTAPRPGPTRGAELGADGRSYFSRRPGGGAASPALRAERGGAVRRLRRPRAAPGRQSGGSASRGSSHSPRQTLRSPRSAATVLGAAAGCAVPRPAPASTQSLAPGGTRRAGRRASARSAGGPRPAPVPARPPPRAVPVPREQCDRHPPAVAGKLEGRRGERGAGAGSGAAPHRSAGKSRRKAAGGGAGARGVREDGKRRELRRRAGGGAGGDLPRAAPSCRRCGRMPARLRGHR